MVGSSSGRQRVVALKEMVDLRDRSLVPRSLSGWIRESGEVGQWFENPHSQSTFTIGDALSNP
ncbi:hypothetical protein Syun_000468 [Stephania yunnanensis]|uniref:Uncharacterized protein n=1 Tax=Stephania yunnanensis TaxID=152371 RepID=A0AAP0LC23_9MAGN